MTSIFVAKLDFGITSEQLKQAFEQYGTVLKASVATDRETGKSRGFGFVEMADREEAMTAIKELDNSMMNGRPIAVKEAEQRADSRPPRDSNSPRPDFKRREGFDSSRSNPSESRSTDFKRPATGEIPPFVPPILPESIKGEVRKKVDKDKDKKGKDWDSEGRSKKPKMNAYKKSGKNNRFFDDDDDDDFDIHSFNTLDEEEYEEEFDDDEEYEDDED